MPSTPTGLRLLHLLLVRPRIRVGTDSRPGPTSRSGRAASGATSPSRQCDHASSASLTPHGGLPFPDCSVKFARASPICSSKARFRDVGLLDPAGTRSLWFRSGCDETGELQAVRHCAAITHPLRPACERCGLRCGACTVPSPVIFPAPRTTAGPPATSPSGEVAGLARPVAAPGRAPGRAPLPDGGRGRRDGALAQFAGNGGRPVSSGSAGPRYSASSPAADARGKSPRDVADDGVRPQNTCGARRLLGAGAGAGDGGVAAELFSSWAKESAAGAVRDGRDDVEHLVKGLAIGREWAEGAAGRGRLPGGRAAALGPLDVLSGNPHSGIAKAMSVLGWAGTGCGGCPCCPVAGRPSTWPRWRRRWPRAGRPAGARGHERGHREHRRLRRSAGHRGIEERYGFWLHVDAAFGAFAAALPTARRARRQAGRGPTRSAWTCTSGSTSPMTRPSSSPGGAICRWRCSTTRPRISDRRGGTGVPASDAGELAPAAGAAGLVLAGGRTGGRGTGRCVEPGAWPWPAGSVRGHRGATRAAAAGSVRLNVVCFTLAADPSRERVAALARAVAASGEAYVTPTEFGGVPGLRAAFSNWRTTEADTERVLRGAGRRPRAELRRVRASYGRAGSRLWTAVRPPSTTRVVPVIQAASRGGQEGDRGGDVLRLADAAEQVR